MGRTYYSHLFYSINLPAHLLYTHLCLSERLTLTIRSDLMVFSMHAYGLTDRPTVLHGSSRYYQFEDTPNPWPPPPPPPLFQLRRGDDCLAAGRSGHGGAGVVVAVPCEPLSPSSVAAVGGNHGQDGINGNSMVTSAASAAGTAWYQEWIVDASAGELLAAVDGSTTSVSQDSSIRFTFISQASPVRHRSN